MSRESDSSQEESLAGHRVDDVYLIDGTGLAYRSFFAFQKRPLRTSTGVETSAVYGFVQTLLQLLAHGPRHVAVVFDLPGPTFRHSMFPEYKAHRPPTPDSLVAQMTKIREIVTALGVRVVELEGVEADDVIATLAKVGEAEERPMVMVTGDKDLFQLVSARVSVLLPGSGRKKPVYLDPDGVRDKMGVAPSQIPDLLSLMGDATDNVPGVPGVGAKTALKLVAQYGSLDAVYEHLGQVEPERLRRSLADHRADAYLSRRLVELKTDLPLGLGIEELHLGIRDAPRLERLFRELEFSKLLADVVPSDPEGPPLGSNRVVATELGDIQAILLGLQDGEAIALEVSCGPAPGLRPKAVHLGLSRGEVYTIPVGGDSDGERLEILRPVLEGSKIPKWVLSSKAVTRALGGLDIRVDGIEFDVDLAAYLLAPGRERDLTEVCALYLGRRPRGIETAASQRALELPLEQSMDVGDERARVILDLVPVLRQCLGDQELDTLFREIEIPLAQVLAEMERSGVKVDVEILREMSRMLEESIRLTEAEVFEQVGETFNLASPQQLKRILFDVLGLKPGRKTKTGYSTDVRVLEALAETHEVPRLVLRYRHLTKLKSTYVDALPSMVNPETGRIHTTFHQTVTATGRLSSSDPNLQNIPTRTELGRELRKAFVSSESDWRIYSADYSQIELRIVAHLAQDHRLMDAFKKGEDVHRATAAAVSGITPEEVPPDARDRAKAVNFGIIYGMGARALSASVGIDLAEARAFIESYFETYPGVRDFIDRTVDEARRIGYVTTLMNRRRYLPDINSTSPRERAFAERTAVNTRVQGTAADIIKLAMVRIARRIKEEKLAARMTLQVHDELVFEAPQEELQRLREIVTGEMVRAAPLVVPVEVSDGEGMNWYEAH